MNWKIWTLICVGGLLLVSSSQANNALAEKISAFDDLSSDGRIGLIYEIERTGLESLDDQSLLLLVRKVKDSEDDRVTAAAIGLLNLFALIRPDVVQSTIDVSFLTQSIEEGSDELAVEAAKLAKIMYEGDSGISQAFGNRASRSLNEPETLWQLLKLLPGFGDYSPRTVALLNEVAVTHRDTAGKYAIIALTDKAPGDTTLTDSALAIMETPRLFCDMTLLSMVGESLPVERRHVVRLEEMDALLREQSARPAAERSVSIYNDAFYRTKMDETLVRTRAATSSVDGISPLN